MILEQYQSKKNPSDKKDTLLKGKKMFIQGLYKHILHLQQLLKSLEDHWDRERAQHVYHTAHTIKGSAPMFGFHSIGQLAESLENLWELPQDNGDVIDMVAEKVLISKGYLHRLKQEYEACIKEIEFDESGGYEPQGIQPLDKNRILLVDDDDVFRCYLVEKLKFAGYLVDEASTVGEAKTKLCANSYDLITLDLLMYPESGYELFEFLKDDATFKWLPVIVLSGKNVLQDKVRCLRLGADDYVVKPFEFSELEARIHRLLTRSSLLEEMAFRDPLTGIYNRRYFNQQVEFEVHRVKRCSRSLSIAFIDVDHFKRVNDTYGHQIGDFALQALGEVILQNLRSTDLLARYGGEEFVVMFPDTSQEIVVEIMERILHHVREHPILKRAEHELFITFSAGVVGWSAGFSASDLIQMADDAAYQAKREGRNCVVVSQGKCSSLRDEFQIFKKKLLIADDDVAIRSLLKSRLYRLPIDILEAVDGEETIQKLESEEIDLLILDGLMPKKNGFEILEWVRSNPRFESLKIIMLSGLNKEETISKSFSLGANEYIAKPFSLPEMEIRVKQHLGITVRKY